jgi:hypothetical protein
VKLSEIAERLHLENLTPELASLGAVDVTKGHASDLLSDVLANAPRNGVLVTIQVHMNVLAVAVQATLSAVILSSGRRPDEAVRAKAVEEQMPLYAAGASTFEVAGQLYALGLRGRHA